MSNQNHTLKTYVQVNVEFNDEGVMRPRGILWEDGQYFEIDKVLDMAGAGLSEEDRITFYKSLGIISKNLENICKIYDK